MDKNILNPGAIETALFTNWTDEDFGYPKDEHCRWDGVPYSFPKGSKTLLPAYLAAHFAKHLVNRELNKMASEIGSRAYADSDLRTKLTDRCYADNISEEAVAKAEEDLKVKFMNMKKDDLLAAAKKAGVSVDKKANKETIAQAMADAGNKDDDDFAGNE